MRWSAVLALSLTACASGSDSNTSTSAPLLGSDGGGDASASGDETMPSGPTSDGETSGDSVPGDGSDGSAGGTDGSTGAVDPAPPWLVAVDDGGLASRLVRIDPATAATTEVCQLPSGRNYTSLVLTRDGELLAYSEMLDTIQAIDPCSCAVGDVMGGLGVLHIGGGSGSLLHALVPGSGSLYGLDVVQMSSQLIGPVDLGMSGSAIAWSDPLDALYVLASDSDELYFLDPDSLTTVLIGSLGVDVGSAGLAYHHGLEELYGCAESGDLLRIDTSTATATAIGNLGYTGCDNLAAPWGPVACI